MRNNNNWAAFIQECYKSKSFHGQSLRDKHRVDARLIYTLVEQEVIIKTNNKGIYNWIYNGVVDDEFIKKLIKIHGSFISEYHRKRREMANKPLDKIVHRQVENITERQAIDTLLAIGGYEIYKVERKLLK